MEKRYILFNCDGFDGCIGADGIVELFKTKDELFNFVRTTDFQDDTISIYDIKEGIAYDNQTLWEWDDDNYEEKIYWKEEITEYLNGIK